MHYANQEIQTKNHFPVRKGNNNPFGQHRIQNRSSVHTNTDIEWMTLQSFQCHRSIYICCVFDIFAPLLPKGLLCSWLCSSYNYTHKSCAGGTYRKSDLWPLSTHNDDKNTLTPATSISVVWLWLIMMCNAERHQVCLLRHRNMCPPLVSDMS